MKILLTKKKFMRCSHMILKAEHKLWRAIKNLESSWSPTPPSRNLRPWNSWLAFRILVLHIQESNRCLWKTQILLGHPFLKTSVDCGNSTCSRITVIPSSSHGWVRAFSMLQPDNQTFVNIQLEPKIMAGKWTWFSLIFTSFIAWITSANMSS